MKKQLFVIAFALCSCLNAFSQETSLTVDCQNPGWLSNLISYSEQQAVTDLTITGYLNATDLEFVGTIMKNHSLKRLDMTDVEIISSDASQNNVLPQNMFNLDYFDRVSMDIIALPLSTKSIFYGNPGCFNCLQVDTLVMGGPAMPVIENSPFTHQDNGSSLNSTVKCLIIREGVESLAKNCFCYSYYNSNGEGICLKKVVLPSTLKTIGDRALYGNTFEAIDLPESVEEIGAEAFWGYKTSSVWAPDTVFLPKSIKKYNTSAFNRPSKVYYFPEGIEYIDNRDLRHKSDMITLGDNIEIHLRATTPPQFDYQSYNCLLRSVVYVPQGTAAQYNLDSPWKDATIIEEIFVKGISIDKQKTMYIGDKETMLANILPENATNQKVYWHSSNPNVASISEEGILTALAFGNTDITAISADGNFSAICKVNVYNHTTGIQLSNQVTLPVGGSYELNAKTLPLNTSDGSIKYSSSNNYVATISDEGTIMAVAKGSCTITATSVDGGYTATCEVTVTQPVEALTLEKHSLSLKVGNSETLFAQISPSTADNKTITWSSSNAQVASVDVNGNVAALKAGEVWIKAVSNDNAEAKDSCKVTVLQPVTGITLSQESCRLTNIGEFVQLEATVLPDDASNKEVNWRSTNEAVCMVSNGKVVATGYGTAVVLATTVDGGFMASCAIVVEKDVVSVTEVVLSQTSATLIKGATLQLTATALPADATNKTLIWKSSDENVCVTTQTGMLVAMNEGTAVITVVPELGVGQAQCNVTVEAEPSAIHEIIGNNADDSAIYDMQGRRVNQVVKGRLYIVNGKKYIAK